MSGRQRNFGATPEQLQMLVDLLPTAGSFRDIGLMMGQRLDWVRANAMPFLTIMKVSGTHPVCGCGKPRFHPYGCVHNHRPAYTRTPAPGLRRADAVTRMILTGESFDRIEKALGMPPKAARKYLKLLTDDQRAERKRLELARQRYRRGGSATSPDPSTLLRKAA